MTEFASFLFQIIGHWALVGCCIDFFRWAKGKFQRDHVMVNFPRNISAEDRAEVLRRLHATIQNFNDEKANNSEWPTEIG